MFLCVKTIRSCTMAGMPALHYLTHAYLVSHRIHIRRLLFFYLLKLLYYLDRESIIFKSILYI